MSTSPDDHLTSRAAVPSDVTGLLSRAAEGDAESWAEITDRFTNLVWAIARSHQLSADDSTDVVRSTWLRLLESLRHIDQPEALPGWLAATARREALDLLGRRSSSGDHQPPAVQLV